MSAFTDTELAELELRYSLAKRVPAMRGGFTIATNYGDIHIDAEDAAPLAAVVETLLRVKLEAK